jgi:predicted acyltransferase
MLNILVGFRIFDQTLNIMKRIVSIDFLRGLTIFLMIIVNNPGSWGAWDDVNNVWVNHLFLPLSHAHWNGCTPTDLIFPFFVIIMGCSIAFALSSKKDNDDRSKLLLKVLKRGALIFLLGFLKDNFPYYIITDGGIEMKAISNYRIMGVLQRLGLTFMITGAVFIYTNWKQQIGVLVAVLLGYWGLINIEIADAFTKDLSQMGGFNLGTYIDKLILGESHLWRTSASIPGGWEPEGLLGTITTVGSCLIGVLVGSKILEDKGILEKISFLFSMGAILTVIGLFWDMYFPINKGLWTSTYVLYTGGIATMCIAFSLYIIDAKNIDSFTKPAIHFGSNALTAYLLSELVSSLIHNIPIGEGETVSSIIANSILCFFTKTPFHEITLNHPDLFWAKLASHLYAFLWIIPFYFLIRWMYNKKIFIKV